MKLSGKNKAWLLPMGCITATILLVQCQVNRHAGNNSSVSGTFPDSETPLSFATHVYNPGPMLTEVGLTTNLNPFTESILANPAVHKKQVAGNLVQAVGFMKTGQTHFVVHFKREVLHGHWQSFYPDGQPCDSGKVDQWLPDGEWKTWYANGRLKTVRTYSAQKYRYVLNDWRLNHPRFPRYAITKMPKDESGEYFQPRYDDINGKSWSLLNRIRHNTSLEWETYLPPFKNCLHHGVFINYDQQGVARDSGEYVNGLRHGIWKESGIDGTSALGLYRHGLRNGQWKYYDENGRLVYSETYNQRGNRKSFHSFRKN